AGGLRRAGARQRRAGAGAGDDARGDPGRERTGAAPGGAQGGGRAPGEGAGPLAAAGEGGALLFPGADLVAFRLLKGGLRWPGDSTTSPSIAKAPSQSSP